MELLRNIKSCIKCNSNDTTVSYAQPSITFAATPVKATKYNPINGQLKKQLAQANLKLNFQSNHIQYNQENLVNESAMEFPLLVTTPEKQRNVKLTSTFMHSESYTILENELTQISPTFSQIFHNQSVDQDELDGRVQSHDEFDGIAFSNECYASPAIENIATAFSNQLYQSPEINSTRQALNFVDLCNETELQPSFGIDSNDFQSVNPSFFENSIQEHRPAVFVCCIAYKAKEHTELNLEFSERVCVLNEIADLYLVKNIANNKCGYVPKYCITTLNQFLKDLKYLNL
jgi:hypothetical protein